MLNFGGIGTVMVIIFLVWSLLAGDPGGKIERGCRPVDWMGNAVTSMVAMTTPSFVDSVDYGFARADYGCQYMLWRLFYESSWQQAIADGRIDPETGKPSVEDEQHSRRYYARRSSEPDTPDSDDSSESSPAPQNNARPYPYPLKP